MYLIDQLKIKITTDSGSNSIYIVREYSQKTPRGKARQIFEFKVKSKSSYYLTIKSKFKS